MDPVADLSTGSWRNERATMRIIPIDETTPTEVTIDVTPSETFERLRVAAASRASLLRAAHLRLEDDLRDLRQKAAAGR